MWACYLAQALDKGALTTASIMGLQKDTVIITPSFYLTKPLIMVYRV